MASLKIVGNIQKILPFAALIGSIACFNQWRKKLLRNTKSSGISLWRILSPILVSFFFLGFFSITILSPFSTLLNKKYENLQTLFFGKVNVQGFSFDTKGLWIKQSSKQNYLIINANKINEKDNTLYNLNIFEYDKDKIFLKRLNAKKGRFTDKKLLLYDVRSIDRNSQVLYLKEHYYLINFDSNRLKVVTEKPEKFFTRFSILFNKNEILWFKYFQTLSLFFKLICQPFLIISMILLSASLMLRSSERKVEVGIVSLSLIVGFSLYFIGDFIFCLRLYRKNSSSTCWIWANLNWIIFRLLFNK